QKMRLNPKAAQFSLCSPNSGPSFSGEEIADQDASLRQDATSICTPSARMLPSVIGGPGGGLGVIRGLRRRAGGTPSLHRRPVTTLRATRDCGTTTDRHVRGGAVAGSAAPFVAYLAAR